MRISDWALYGRIVQKHVQGNSNPSYFNIFGSTAGSYTSHVAGYMVPAGQDTCDTTGPHVHQYYQSLAYDDAYYKNGAIPTRAGCDLCYDPYPIWSTHEYLIQFTK